METAGEPATEFAAPDLETAEPREESARGPVIPKNPNARGCDRSCGMKAARCSLPALCARGAKELGQDEQDLLDAGAARTRGEGPDGVLLLENPAGCG